MSYLSAEDFLNKVNEMTKISKAEINALCADFAGNKDARQKIFDAHLSMIAFHVGKLPVEKQTLNVVYACINELNEALDTFDFSNVSESFTNYFNRRLRHCIMRNIVSKN